MVTNRDQNGCPSGAVQDRVAGHVAFRNMLRHVRPPASSHRSRIASRACFGGGNSEESRPRERLRAAAPDANRAELSPFSIRACGHPLLGRSRRRQAAVGTDVRYQATITLPRANCTVQRSPDSRSDRVLGRVIAGRPYPGDGEYPLRVAVVQCRRAEITDRDQVFGPRSRCPKPQRTVAALVSEIGVSVPPGATGDAYVFYIGFDPQAAIPAEPKRLKDKLIFAVVVHLRDRSKLVLTRSGYPVLRLLGLPAPPWNTGSTRIRGDDIPQDRS